MMNDYVIKYGKKFYYDSALPYNNFRNRLTLLKRVHPKLKYTYTAKGKLFYLYVRRWGL